VGFGSDYVHTVLAVAYAVLKQRQFRINSTYWNYGIYARMFKEPSTSAERYCKQPIDVSELEDIKAFVASGDQNASHLSFSRYTIQKGKWVSGAITDAFTTLRLLFGGPFVNYTEVETIRHIAHALWQLTDKMNETVYSMLNNTDITQTFDMHQPYVGLQIRRGDHTKSREDFGQKGYEPISAYGNVVLNASTIDDEEISQVFVMTDDFNSILELSKYLNQYGNYTIAYLPNAKNRRGHSQGNWDILSWQGRGAEMDGKENIRYKTEIAELIAELEMMRKADVVGCTYYSGLCAVIQMIRRQPPETLTDVGNFGWSIIK